MTTNNQTSVELNNNSQTSLSPGMVLAEARERLGLSIEDVASSLKLRGSVIEAIENDDYSKIARQVFAKGYLRAYAHLVHIDAESVIASFKAAKFMGDETTKMLWHSSKAKVATSSKPTKKSNPVKWLFMLLSACLILFAGMWMNANRISTSGNGLKMALTINEPNIKLEEKILVDQESLDENINTKGNLS